MYHELRDQHCGARDESCSVPAHIYNRIKPLADAYRAAYDHYWNCWQRNALDSEYPGHIPYSCE